MVDIQSPTAEIRRGKKEEGKKIEITGQKYNGATITRGWRRFLNHKAHAGRNTDDTLSALSVHSHHPQQRRNGPVCCCMTLFSSSALQCNFNEEEIRPWWPWPLTFDLDIQTRPSEGRNTSSLWIWRSGSRYFIHKQKCHRRMVKNRTLRSSLRAVMTA